MKSLICIMKTSLSLLILLGPVFSNASESFKCKEKNGSEILSIQSEINNDNPSLPLTATGSGGASNTATSTDTATATATTANTATSTGSGNVNSKSKYILQIYKELCFTDLSYHKPITMGCFSLKTNTINYENKLIKIIEKGSSLNNGILKLQYSHYFNEAKGYTSGRSYPYLVEYLCTKEN